MLACPHGLALCEKCSCPVLDLLAVIHSDGGHYSDKVGVEQAIKDAIIIVVAMKQIITDYDIRPDC